MAFLELNKDKNLRRDETPFEEQLTTYWGDWGICSQVAPLKSVMLRRPGSEMISNGKKQDSERGSILINSARIISGS